MDNVTLQPFIHICTKMLDYIHDAGKKYILSIFLPFSYCGFMAVVCFFSGQIPYFIAPDPKSLPSIPENVSMVA